MGTAVLRIAFTVNLLSYIWDRTAHVTLRSDNRLQQILLLGTCVDLSSKSSSLLLVEFCVYKPVLSNPALTYTRPVVLVREELLRVFVEGRELWRAATCISHQRMKNGPKPMATR